LKVAGTSQLLFDETARQALYQASKGIPRKVNKLALITLRLAAARQSNTVTEALVVEAAQEALL
ncbi:MAG: AAA family ATPase, partial [Acidobacteria bacterium]|nr:AAA family ATPase [Acidobacteriota bacterium]